MSHSCYTALEGWTALLQDEIPVNVVYLDFTKARHLVKFQACDITSEILNWVRVVYN